jgi:hypothetical protein
MRDPNTPDLFSLLDEAPTGALVIPFPQNRNVGKARRTAQTFLKRRTEASRDRYWRRTIETLERQLSRAGLNNAEIEGQITAFRSVVQFEIDRANSRNDQPGGTPY